MYLSRRWVAAVVAAGLLAGLAVSGWRGASAAKAAVSPTGGQGRERTVTLVTGDRVTVWAGGKVSAQAGPGRTGMTFTTTTASGHARVVPADAGPLLAAGRLDARLFDVTGLLAAGYDRRDYLPLIVTGAKGATAGATREELAGVAGLGTQRDLPAVGGVAVREAHAHAAESWQELTGADRAARSLRPGLGRIWLDGVRTPVLDVSVPQVGAPAAWQAGYTGAGVTVAVLDTGIDDTHPDLAGQVIGRSNFTEGFEPDNDLSGHGTHVAATIASTGAGSDGRYKGVAPGAKLLDGKVCVIWGCAESWIIAGMTWAAADRHAKVVNLSLGGPDDPAVVDPVEQAVQTLSDQYGTLIVIAAGNTGGGVVEGAISSPGAAPAALTVGAVDDHDALAEFSRRGPGPDGAIKPEITAPGVDITAARGKDATEVPGNPGDLYTTLSGTSMATPHVAGAAAILAQQHTGWSGRQLKAALTGSAGPLAGYGVYAQGAGRLDVARAVRQDVTGTATVTFGRQLWPHTDDQVQTRDVTYHNDGATAVTLALSLATTGPDGTPTPPDMFTASETSITVPAGGEATVTVTADTRLGPDGHAGGWLTATAADLVVRTPVAVDKEVESYDVTLTHLDRNGSTPSYFDTVLTNRESQSLVQFDWWGPDPGNTVTLRVPKGHYTLTSFLETLSGWQESGKGPVPVFDHSLLAEPDLNVDHTLTVTIDARLGQPVSVTVPRSSAGQVYGEVAAFTRRPGGTAGAAVLGSSYEHMNTAQIGPDTSDDNFYSIVAGQWARANADGSTDDSPYFYSLMFPEHGRMVTGYQRSVVDKDLAQVRADFAQAQPGVLGAKRVGTAFTDLDIGNEGPDLVFHPPFTRTEYYNADPGIASRGGYTELSDEDWNYVMSASYTHYSANRTYHERWNTGVFAPSLAGGDWAGVTREGDDLLVDVPLFSDGAGRPGASATTSLNATLYRDGVKLVDMDGERFSTTRLPSEEASYRLEMHAERVPYALSTRVDIAWTFRSGHVDGAPLALPLWSIRFAPELDQFNTAPANGVQAVPVFATPQQGGQVGKLSRLTVEASFDDGATWTSVQVIDGEAMVHHPQGQGFVSLKATAADTGGNSVEQTIIHAYRYGQTR